MELIGKSADVTLGQKVKLILAAPFLFAAMIALLAFGLVSMEVRNLGRWLVLIGEWGIGGDTFYKDLWPLTVGNLWDAYKEVFGFGKS